MTIPIRNLYFIFCYAWARFPPGDAATVGKDTCPDLPNLFAKLLIDGLYRLMRRGLHRSYVEIIEDTRSPHGRLLLDEMIKRQTMLRGLAACRFDELQADILHNQILKATARSLSRAQSLLPAYRHDLGMLIQRLDSISDVRLSASIFSQAQVSRNNQQYALLLRLCEFVFHSVLPDSEGAASRFADILKDEVRMSTVFEEFLRNFYAHEQSEYRVKREIMPWAASALTETGSSLMPIMETDISLSSPTRSIVIDAKYYKEPLAGRPGFSKKLRSGHLYQLFTYLHHARLRSPAKQIDGALIYASAGLEFSADYAISGHQVRVSTIRLDREWPEIHRELLNLLHRPFASKGGVVVTEAQI